MPATAAAAAAAPSLPAVEPLVLKRGFKHHDTADLTHASDITVGDIKHKSTVCLTSTHGSVLVTGKVVHGAHLTVLAHNGTVDMRGRKIAHHSTVYIYAAGDVNIHCNIKHGSQVFIRTAGRVVLHGRLAHHAVVNWCASDLTAIRGIGTGCMSAGVKCIERQWNDPVFVDPRFPACQTAQRQQQQQQYVMYAQQPQQVYMPMQYKTVDGPTPQYDQVAQVPMGMPPAYSEIKAIN